MHVTCRDQLLKMHYICAKSERGEPLTCTPFNPFTPVCVRNSTDINHQSILISGSAC